MLMWDSPFNRKIASVNNITEVEFWLFCLCFAQPSLSESVLLNSSVRRASRRTAAKRHLIITRPCTRDGLNVLCAGDSLEHSVPETCTWEMCTIAPKTSFVTWKHTKIHDLTCLSNLLMNNSTVICKNLVSGKVNKIELDIGLEGSDYAASIGANRISVPCFKTEIFNSKSLASPSDTMLCRCSFLRFSRFELAGAY